MKPNLTEPEVTGPNPPSEPDDAIRSIKRAYVETHMLGPPLVPVVVAVRRIMEYIGKATGANQQKAQTFGPDLNVRLLCPECRDPNPEIVEELSSGVLVCGGCGLVWVTVL